MSLATVLFEIGVLELVRIAMLPKIRQKCPWGSQFGGLCRRHSIESILWSMYFFARNREDRYSTYTQFYRIVNTLQPASIVLTALVKKTGLAQLYVLLLFGFKLSKQYSYPKECPCNLQKRIYPFLLW